jgi:hypothetical protein
MWLNYDFATQHQGAVLTYYQFLTFEVLKAVTMKALSSRLWRRVSW